MYLCVLGKSLPHGMVPVYYNFTGNFAVPLKLLKQEYRTKEWKLHVFTF